MKHKYLYIAVFVVLVFAMCAGYVSLVLRQQTLANDMVASMQGMKSAFLEKIESKLAPTEKSPVASSEACHYINDGYFFSVTKPWTLLSSSYGNKEEIDISKWLPMYLVTNEMTRGIAAMTVADSNTVYFSTRGEEADTTTINRLYSLSLTTHKLTKIFEQTNTDHMVWRVRGFDGNKLVILNEGVDNSPGPCAPEWGTAGYLAFDISAPGQGMASYRVSQCLIDLAESKSEACAQAI